RWRDTAALSPALRENGVLGNQYVTPLIVEAGLEYRLTGNAEALAHVESQIALLLARYKDAADSKTKRWAVVSHNMIALAADLCRDGLSPAARASLLELMAEYCIGLHHGRIPFLYYSAGANIPLAANIHAAVCALTWGEEAGARGWDEVVDITHDYCRAYLQRGVDASGNSYEGTGYGHECFYYITLYAQLLLQNGRQNLFLEEPVLERIPDASLQICLPDRSGLTNINDMGLIFPWSMPWLLLTARHYRRPDHLGFWYEFCGPDHPERPCGDVVPWYVKTFGADTLRGFEHIPSLALALLWLDSEAPATPIAQSNRLTAHYAPGTETACFRTSWSPDAVYANVLGQGRSVSSLTHGHADAGHFSLFAHGDYLAIDTGRYNTDEDRHNVVLVDGVSHAPTGGGLAMNPYHGRLLHFQTSPLVDAICADAAQVKGCIWANRYFLFVKGDGDAAYFVTVDSINKHNDHRTFHWQLNTHPDFEIGIESPHRAVIRGARTCLDVHFVSPGPDDFSNAPHTLTLRQDIAYWQSGKDNANPEALKTGLMVTCYRCPRLVAEQTGLCGQLMAVMAPRRKQAPPTVIRTLVEKRWLAAEVEFGPYVDTLIAAPDHGYIRLPDGPVYAEILLRRHDRQGRRVAQWTMRSLAGPD
ncbi:MAG: heparinase II/III family protein, partial [Lentisphaerae bacterium]|nr:heparinase II/III family protein [Lentisphaerota bacterium]